MMSTDKEKIFGVEEIVKRLRQRVSEFPKQVVVLGSGWNKVLQQVKQKEVIPYSELFGVTSSVPGHDGKLIIGSVNDHNVAWMAGRFHTYEGYSSEEVTRPLQAFSQMDAEQFVITAAVGALNPRFRVGDFIVLCGMLEKYCQSPLSGAQFANLSEPFDPQLSYHALQTACAQNLPVHEGVYAYMRGPHYETPDTKIALYGEHADVVGMSTVPETIMANYLGVPVLGLSYVTNLAFVEHNHKDVLAAAEAAGDQMARLLVGVLSE